MFPDEIRLVFLKNALKNWLPWCCSADKILHLLPLSSHNGSLSILRIGLPHLDTLWKEQGRGPEESVRSFLPSPRRGAVSQQTRFVIAGAGLVIGEASWPEGTLQATSPLGAASWGRNPVHFAQHKLEGCFQIWTLIFSYLRANRCSAETIVFIWRNNLVLKINIYVFIVSLFYIWEGLCSNSIFQPTEQ